MSGNGSAAGRGGVTGYVAEHFLISQAAPFVVHVEINRPRKLNAFHEPMWLELGRIFSRLSHDPNVRAIVLSGAGDRAFCAGLDVEAASKGLPTAVEPGTKALDAARTAAVTRRYIREFQDCVGQVEACEKRTVIPRAFRPPAHSLCVRTVVLWWFR